LQPKKDPNFAEGWQALKACYQNAIRDKVKRNTTMYTNKLHD